MRLLAAAWVAGALVASLLSRLRTGLGVVAVMASAAIVIATVSLIISARAARQISALNKPPDESGS